MATAAERRAYARKLREISRSLDQLERATLQQSIRLLRDVRDRIAGQITGTDFSQFRVAEQQQALDDIIANYESQVRALANGSSRQAFALGERSVIEPLQAANVGVAYFRPSEAQVNILAQFSADLVGGVADDMRRKINTSIRMNALGGQSSLDAMRDITQVLFKSNRPISEKAKLTKGIAYEAERILRTETNRTYQLAAFSQQEQLAKDIPGLQKQWIATADSRTRLTHLNAHGQIVDVDKPFSVNGAKMMYPLDPAGGPSETINCRCDSITVIPEIGPVETPLDEKIEAEKARRDKSPLIEIPDTTIPIKGKSEASDDMVKTLEQELGKIESDYEHLPSWISKVDLTPKAVYDEAASYDAFDMELRFQNFYAKLNKEEFHRAMSSGRDADFFVNRGDQMRATVIHEIGHAVDNNVMWRLRSEPGLQDRYIQELANLREELGSPSEYAKKNNREWAAERFTLERLDKKNELQNVYHKWIKVIEDLGFADIPLSEVPYAE